MKMMMFLLLSAAALMLSPAVAKAINRDSRENLQKIIDIARQYNGSATLHYFVEDLSALAVGCKDKFFCKAYAILNTTEHFRGTLEEVNLVRNLLQYILGTRANCTNVQKVNGDQETIPKLVTRLLHCATKVFRHGNGTSP
ncbi:hypothetical protein PBY51_002922 [Eleginops maclovinus]|uniref:Interleukin-4 n=1 Tax=Eleginops maclovinus TaxID=56733 RepID=A0AAN8AL00_ELEMC|nr:hypothetical protein PBY51_002922 [Eleginops maclovinus]